MQSAYDEIRRMAFRALDAAGAPPGIDEDSAHAVAWLEAVGLSGLALLAAALDAPDTADRGAGLECPAASSPIMTIEACGRSSVFHAASVVDLLFAEAQISESARSAITVRETRHPPIFVATAARYRPRGAVVSVAWNGAEAQASDNGTVVTAETDALDWDHPGPLDVTLACAFRHETDLLANEDILEQRLSRALSGGIEVDDRHYARLAVLAARILVPETDISRKTGAGAGLTDND